MPGETADSALMFLPTEAVYAELHASFPTLVNEAGRARVWIVSPTTFMATLTTVRAVLKDVRMREQADMIQREVGQLCLDVERLGDRADKLQRHFEVARTCASCPSRATRSPAGAAIKDVELGGTDGHHANSEQPALARLNEQAERQSLRLFGFVTLTARIRLFGEEPLEEVVKPFTIFVIVLVVLAIMLVMMGVKTVPQGYEYTVERFGRYTRTLKPGLASSFRSSIASAPRST